ncbi:unnamed protein product [Allacma fusca]|uniref:Uncharacterized protein n=1 Tax=Allacma fusca TaxID=39272 RepID=A0A8J2K783_9HEXA|nr:unnamed protein product [Allacma fusca]
MGRAISRKCFQSLATSTSDGPPTFFSQEQMRLLVKVIKIWKPGTEEGSRISALSYQVTTLTRTDLEDLHLVFIEMFCFLRIIPCPLLFP